MRGFEKFTQPGASVDGITCDVLRACPLLARRTRPLDAAGVGELAFFTALGPLIDDAADGPGPAARARAIEHDLCHRDLADVGLAAGFEVDRFGEAADAGCVGECEFGLIDAGASVDVRRRRRG